MHLWAGAAWTKGYDQCVSVHCVVAATEEEAKRLVLDEASKAWPEWWRSYPYEVKVKAADSKIVESLAYEELR